MSSHAGTNSIQELYEGDQSKLYSGVMSHHTDINGIESKNQVKRIWKITFWLSVITIAEVALGLTGYKIGMSHAMLAILFLAGTLLKAGLIVRVFMHLGDEKSNFVITVLIPLVLFVWFIIAFLADGSFWLHMNNNVKAGMKTEATK